MYPKQAWAKFVKHQTEDTLSVWELPVWFFLGALWGAVATLAAINLI